MSRTTPEETFAEARAAMERGDWDGCFACLDPDNLVRIAENGVARFMVGSETIAEAFTALCGEHAVAEEMISKKNVQGRRRWRYSARQPGARRGSP